MPEPPTITPIRHTAGCRTAVVLIHGFSGKALGTWADFSPFLRDEPKLQDWDLHAVGYKTTKFEPDWLTGVWTADAPLELLAGLLYTSASYPPLSQYDSLVLVAHSMGGLIVQRALIDHADLAERTGNVILFGTPSGGLTKANPFSFWKRQVRDMAAGSPFITDLRTRWKAGFDTPAHAPFRFLSVAGDRDEFVPAVSSLEPFPTNQRAVVAGNHLSILEASSAADLGIQIVINSILGDAAPAGPANAARVALEVRDFVRTINLLWPHRDELDERGLVNLALALEETGRQADAIELLDKLAGDQTDAMGTLAGRLKRRWLVESRRKDAERALGLYRKAYDLAVKNGRHDQAFYHGINVAFMELAFGSDYTAARQAAEEVLTHCESADKEAGGNEAAHQDFWETMTEGDARLILGQTGAAMERYRAAVALKPKPRDLKSACLQTVRLADLLNEEEIGRQMTALSAGVEV